MTGKQNQQNGNLKYYNDHNWNCHYLICGFSVV